MSCDGSAPYTDQVVDAPQDSYETWTVGGLYYARGPCPVCGAVQEAHSRGYIVIEFVPGQSPDGEVEVAFRCRCGRDHGRPGASGCGARWVVPWREQEPAGAAL